MVDCLLLYSCLSALLPITASNMFSFTRYIGSRLLVSTRTSLTLKNSIDTFFFVRLDLNEHLSIKCCGNHNEVSKTIKKHIHAEY